MTALKAPPCAHPNAVPVTLLLTEEPVAALCPDCGSQLPAEWIGCEHRTTFEITMLDDAQPRWLCADCNGMYQEAR